MTRIGGKDKISLFMAKYILGYRIEGSLKSHNPGRSSLDFKFRDFDIKIPTVQETDSSHFVCYFGPIEAEAMVKANDLANEILSEFLDILSFVTKTSLFVMGICVGLKEGSGTERVVYRNRYWEEDQRPLSIREDASETVTIKDLLTKAENNDGYDLSMRWLRYSYRARGYLDQFTYYWLALERLIGESQVNRPCEYCPGKTHTYPGIDKSAVHALLKKFNPEIDRAGFEKIWKARNRIFHGNPVDTDFMIDLVRISPLVVKTVEGELVERLNPRARLDFGRPHPAVRLVSQDGFYKFRTTTPEAPFPFDFPTDVQLKEFKEEGTVVSSTYGFEWLISFQDGQSW